MNAALLPSAGIDATLMFRDQLCCIAIDAVAATNVSFNWSRQRLALECNRGRQVVFPNSESTERVQRLLMKHPENIAVIEFGAWGQVLREHKIGVIL